MEPEEMFIELKEKIIDRHRGIIFCNVRFEEDPENYTLRATFGEEFSYIRFPKKDLTQIYIDIALRGLGYYAHIKLPSRETAKMYLLDARKANTCDDYLSLFEVLMTFPTLYEHTQEILFAQKRVSLYKTGYDMLRRVIFKKKDDTPYYEYDVALYYEYYMNDDLMEHNIYVFTKLMALTFIITKNTIEVESEVISFKKVPRAIKSIVRYMLRVSSLNDYFRLEKAVIELIRLVKVEKRDIDKAIKELIDKRGYWDIFGY